jgi:hypothetical protein
VTVLLAGCGGSDDSSSTAAAAGLTDESTCAEWNAAAEGAGAQDRDAFLAEKGYEDNTILAGWVDNLCGRGGVRTPYSDQSTLGEIYPVAQERFAGGQQPPPIPSG